MVAVLHRIHLYVYRKLTDPLDVKSQLQRPGSFFREEFRCSTSRSRLAPL
jgi:hypothetical protein